MSAKTITLTYDELVFMLKAAKQAAIDSGSMTEAEGYSELEGKAVAVADDCWLKGMSDFETAVLNWAYDDMAGHPRPIVPLLEAKRPTPGTVEYDEETELVQEAADAMRNLPKCW